VAFDGGDFVAVRNREFREVLDGADRVRVTNGRAVLELADDVRVELRSGSSVALGGQGVDLRLESGDLLVEAREASFVVDGGLAKMTVDGVAKLRRAVSLVAGVYEGKVLMRSEGDAQVVNRYRQAAAAGTGVLPRQVDPLNLDPDDEWDQRILPKVIDLDTKLVRFGRQFETDLPSTLAVGPELFRQVVPDLSDAPITFTDLSGRAPGENLIGFVLVAQDSGPYAERKQRIFDFREQGASWGLVAADRDLGEVPILNSMEFALGYLAGGAGGQVAETPRGGSTPVGTGGTGGGRTGGTRPGSTPGTPTGPSSPATPPTPQPGPGTTNPGTGQPEPGTNPNPGGPTTPPPPPNDPKVIDVPPLGIPTVDNLLEPIVDPVENLLDGVLDGLLGLGTATSPAPSSEGGKLLRGLLGG
jgi:hypothetical protein